MKRKPVFNILLILISASLIIGLFMPYLLGTIIKSRIEKSIQTSKDISSFHIASVRAYLFKSVLKVNRMAFTLKSQDDTSQMFQGSISSLTCLDVHYFRFIFRKELIIRKIIFDKPVVQGIINPDDSSKAPLIATKNVKLDTIVFQNMNLQVKEKSGSREYNIRNGHLQLYTIRIHPNDTISEQTVSQMNLRAVSIFMISADSSYSVVADSIIYYPLVHVLFASKFEIRPNFSFYGFTGRFQYETDRLQIACRNITLQHFDLLKYIKTGDLLVTSIAVERFDAGSFRDKRKNFRHIRKTTVHQLIRDFPGKLKVDTLLIRSGDITYREHAEKALYPGYIKFTNSSFTITNINNLNNDAILQVKGQTWLMGKGLLTVQLNAPISDKNDRFYVKGSMQEMDFDALNPMLEKSAFISASGKLNKLSFEFNADNHGANGKTIMLYQNMKLTVLDKNHDSTALKEQFLTFLVNRQVINSNPMPRHSVREGIIDYKRDPERFIFSYCFKAIFTGVQTSITGKRKSQKN